jgi:hypothetical protein
MNTKLFRSAGAAAQTRLIHQGFQKSFCASWVLLLLLLPAAAQAQFTFTTNNGTISITGHTGAVASVTYLTIPDTITGLPVTSIGDQAFEFCTSLTNVTMGTNLANIGGQAFEYCLSLTSVALGANVTNIGYEAFADCVSLPTVTIPSRVTSIGDDTFWFCSSLTNVTIPGSVTRIGAFAFGYCTSLTNVMIPSSVTSIGDNAFDSCTALTGVYFQGNAPSLGFEVFYGDSSATVYYLPGTAGWNPQVQTSDGTFGVKTNQFGFTITGSSGLVAVVQASTNLANPVWSPVGTNTLAGGSSYFSDPQWGNYPARFYRVCARTFGGCPLTLWKPQVQTRDGSFGVRTNRFGFNITWASGMVVVVEASTNVATPIWIPLQTKTLTSDSIYFSDAQWTNYPDRFYRIRSP